MASVDANSYAEAGSILRLHAVDNCLVALYSPLLQAIFLHDRQEFGDSSVSATPFDPPDGDVQAEHGRVIWTDDYHAPDLPSPQDWILVLERAKP